MFDVRLPYSVICELCKFDMKYGIIVFQSHQQLHYLWLVWEYMCLYSITCSNQILISNYLATSARRWCPWVGPWVGPDGNQWVTKQLNRGHQSMHQVPLCLVVQLVSNLSAVLHVKLTQVVRTLAPEFVQMQPLIASNCRNVWYAT